MKVKRGFDTTTLHYYISNIKLKLNHHLKKGKYKTDSNKLPVNDAIRNNPIYLEDGTPFYFQNEYNHQLGDINLHLIHGKDTAFGFMTFSLSQLYKRKTYPTNDTAISKRENMYPQLRNIKRILDKNGIIFKPKNIYFLTVTRQDIFCDIEVSQAPTLFMEKLKIILVNGLEYDAILSNENKPTLYWGSSKNIQLIVYDKTEQLKKVHGVTLNKNIIRIELKIKGSANVEMIYGFKTMNDLVINSDNVVERFNNYLTDNFFSNFYKDSLLDEIVQLFNS